jgi:hypothetical protein
MQRLQKQHMYGEELDLSQKEVDLSPVSMGGGLSYLSGVSLIRMRDAILNLRIR